ncbi:hypothetical protein EMIT0210MI2_10414 [Priestia megaterium]
MCTNWTEGDSFVRQTQYGRIASFASSRNIYISTRVNEAVSSVKTYHLL